MRLQDRLSDKDKQFREDYKIEEIRLYERRKVRNNTYRTNEMVFSIKLTDYVRKRKIKTAYIYTYDSHIRKRLSMSYNEFARISRSMGARYSSLLGKYVFDDQKKISLFIERLYKESYEKRYSHVR